LQIVAILLLSLPRFEPFGIYIDVHEEHSVTQQPVLVSGRAVYLTVFICNHHPGTPGQQGMKTGALNIGHERALIKNNQILIGGCVHEATDINPCRPAGIGSLWLQQ
jgi:hypothetical protein